MRQREALQYMFGATLDVAESLDQTNWVVSFSASTSGLTVGVWNGDDSDDREYFANVVTRDITSERMRYIAHEMEAFADTIKGIRKPAEANNV